MVLTFKTKSGTHMDQRDTFKNIQQLLAVLFSLQKEKQTAAFLYDKDGLTRLEGIITSIDEKEDSSKSTVTIDRQQTLLVEQIIAVNGLFRSDYSEC